jgi:hypothetical protein
VVWVFGDFGDWGDRFFQSSKNQLPDREAGAWVIDWMPRSLAETALVEFVDQLVGLLAESLVGGAVAALLGVVEAIEGLAESGLETAEFGVGDRQAANIARFALVESLPHILTIHHGGK